jgi:CheY-like chemotaxis protein
MNDLIRELSALFEVNRPPGVGLEFEPAADLPPVRADGTQIRQVVLNLLSNAAEACELGTGRIRLATSLHEHSGALPPADVSEGVLEPGPYVCLEVGDTGCGMRRSTLQRIFDPFYSTKPSGRGLGLAAVLGIVRGHGGAIQVRSRPGEGSTFRLLLPASPEPLAVQSPSVREAPDSRGATVLVVDDEASVLDTTGRMLEKQGYAVIQADGGKRALELLAARGDTIDVVLLDLTMPDMNGEAVFRALRRLDADLPVVLSSGWSAEESLEGLQALGLSGFLQKPYSLDTLAEVIHSALGRKSG